MDASYIPMFVFLLVGASCNLPFFVRSVRDLCRTSAFTAMPAAPSALLTTALAELSWVLPCLVQCALQAFNGDGPWSAARGGGGCDVMGFYSVFGSIAGMSSTLWVAILTNWPALATARAGYLVSVAIVVSAAIFAALPWMGVGRFAYTGEGFCYFDFHDTALAAVLLAATLPSSSAIANSVWNGLLTYTRVGGATGSARSTFQLPCGTPEGERAPGKTRVSCRAGIEVVATEAK